LRCCRLFSLTAISSCTTNTVRITARTRIELHDLVQICCNRRESLSFIANTRSTRVLLVLMKHADLSWRHGALGHLNRRQNCSGKKSSDTRR
jgi:hypothetical protein